MFIVLFVRVVVCKKHKCLHCSPCIVVVVVAVVVVVVVVVVYSNVHCCLLYFE